MPLPKPLAGIVTPLLTPLRTPGEPDPEGLSTLVEHVLRGGVDGLFVLGTTGEGPALDAAAQRRVVDLAAGAVAGRAPLLVGIAHASRDEALALARHAAEAGADAVVTTGPLYFGVSQQELFAYVRDLAAASPLPVFLYNIPSCSHVHFSVETVERSVQLPNVVGVKDSSGDMLYFHRLVQAASSRPDFSVLIGPEELMAEAVLLGAHGGVNGGSNLFPGLYSSMRRAASLGDLAMVRSLQGSIMAVRGAVYDPTYLPGLKCAAAALGLCTEVFAAPYAAVDAERRRAIREFVAGFAY